MDRYHEMQNILTKEEFREAYQQAWEECLDKPGLQKRLEKPLVFIMGGQPGAGKSTLSDMARDYCADKGGIVHLDLDEVREYIPGYLDMLPKDPEQAVEMSLAPSWAVLSAMRDRAMEERYNILLDQTSGNSGALRATCQEFARHGYEIRVAMQATPLVVSQYQVFDRYNYAVEDKGAGRYVPKEVHDRIAPGVVNSARMLENERRFDHLAVYNQNRQEIHWNVVDNGKLLNPPAAGEKMEQEQKQESIADLRRVSATPSASRHRRRNPLHPRQRQQCLGVQHFPARSRKIQRLPM